MPPRKKAATKPAESRSAAPSLEHLSACRGARMETYPSGATRMARCMECGARRQTTE